MIELVLLLAQTCVAEIDLQNDPRECVEMWAINEAHAERRNITLAEQTRQYNAFWRRPAARRGRPWIEQLTTQDRPPKDWPTRRSWKRESPLWFGYVVAAEKFAVEHFRGSPRVSACVAAGADHYGGPVDGKHADDAAPCAFARAVQCVDGARQVYWNTGPCRRARRARGRVRVISARLAAGKSR